MDQEEQDYDKEMKEQISKLKKSFKEMMEQNSHKNIMTAAKQFIKDPETSSLQLNIDQIANELSV